MGTTTKKAATTGAPTNFRVLALGEADEAYAAIEMRRRDVNRDLATAEAEKRKLAADVKAHPPRRPMSAGVAARVGDTVEADDRLARLKALETTIADCQKADEVLRKRLDEQRGPASAKVCAQAQAEYARRVRVLVGALAATRAAYADLDRLIAELEANDVTWARLGIFRSPGFLERITTIEAEAKERGYV